MRISDVARGARLWWLDTGFACGGIVVDHMKCIDCAPIFRRWFLGRATGTCRQIIRKRGWKYYEME